MLLWGWLLQPVAPAVPLRAALPLVAPRTSLDAGSSFFEVLSVRSGPRCDCDIHHTRSVSRRSFCNQYGPKRKKVQMFTGLSLLTGWKPHPFSLYDPTESGAGWHRNLPS
jgi:hypothetical protein